MKIYAGVTWYNPSQKDKDNYKTYIDFVDKLIIYDNSPQPNEYEPCDKILYINTGENIAIAAFRKIFDIALEENADFLLTLDQDSSYDREDIQRFIARVKDYPDKDNIAIFASCFNKYSKKDKWYKRIATAGNMVNLANYKQIHGIREEMFIDQMDFELCYQFYKVKKKILQFGDCRLKHSFGELVPRRILFLKLKIRDYSLLRNYYAARNVCYIQRMARREGHPFFFMTKFLKEKVLWRFVSVFQGNSKKRIRVRSLAFKHAKLGIMGKANGDVLSITNA